MLNGARALFLRSLPPLLVFTCFIAPATAAAPLTGSMTLSEAYQRALRLSEQVQIAAESRDIADTSHTGALTIMGPQVLATASGAYQNSATVVNPGQPAGVAFQFPYTGNFRASLTQPLFRRQIFDARRATALGVAGAEESLRRAKQQLMFDVTSAFIAVMQSRQQVTIAQSAIKRAETQVQNATGRVKAGGALPTAVLLAQIELSRAQIQSNSAEGVLRQQESFFERFIGEPPPANLILPSTPTPMRDADERAMTTRPDVRALHIATQQSRALVSQLQGRLFWPTLDATLFAGYIINGNGAFNANDPFSRRDSRFPVYGITGFLSLPFFQGGDEWVQVKLQRQRTAIAAYNESFQRRAVSDDVRRANARVEVARRAIDLATEQQKVAQQNYQLVSNHYKLGVATLLEVVTAQTAAFEAETNKALAQYENELATYGLLFAQGEISL